MTAVGWRITKVQSYTKLRITQCKDPLMWYYKLVGQEVPFLGVWPGEGYKSREPAGFVNIVKFSDAEMVDANDSQK